MLNISSMFVYRGKQPYHRAEQGRPHKPHASWFKISPAVLKMSYDGR